MRVGRRAISCNIEILANPDYSMERAGIACHDGLSGRVSSNLVYAPTKLLRQSVTTLTATPITLIVMCATFRILTDDISRSRVMSYAVVYE